MTSLETKNKKTEQTRKRVNKFSNNASKGTSRCTCDRNFHGDPIHQKNVQCEALHATLVSGPSVLSSSLAILIAVI